MAENFEYKPKGIDIRVNKGKKKVDPNQEECEWAGCVAMGGCKAPKSPDRLREYYNFCAPHTREYNKNWNFFSGMSDEDIHEWQAGARHGHRPTWDVRKNTGERAQARKKTRAGQTSATSESYGIFGNGDNDIAETPADACPRCSSKRSMIWVLTRAPTRLTYAAAIPCSSNSSTLMLTKVTGPPRKAFSAWSKPIRF